MGSVARRSRWPTAFAASFAVASTILPAHAAAREAALSPGDPICALRSGGVAGASHITVQADTASGFWSLRAPLDGRRHSIGQPRRPEVGATWAPRDAAASGIAPRPDSRLVYLEATSGSLSARLQPAGAAADADLRPGAVRAVVRASGLVLDDGTRIDELAELDLTCLPPRLDGPIEMPWPPLDTNLEPGEAHRLAVFSDAYPPPAELTERSRGRPADDAFLETLLASDGAPDWSRFRERSTGNGRVFDVLTARSAGGPSVTYHRLAGSTGRAASLVCRVRSRAGIDEVVGEATQWCFDRLSEPVDAGNLYRLTGRFDPATGNVAISGTLSIVADRPTDRVELILDRRLWIDRIDCGPKCAVKIDRDLPPGDRGGRVQRVVLQPERPLVRDERLGVAFAYEGILPKAYRARRPLTLRADDHWYPTWAQEPLARADIRLELPDAFELAAPARPAGTETPTRWIITPSEPMPDSITVTRKPESK